MKNKIFESPKRVNFLISPRCYEEIHDIAQRKSCSVTEIIRRGLTLLKYVDDLENKGGKLLAKRGDQISVIKVL